MGNLSVRGKRETGVGAVGGKVKDRDVQTPKIHGVSSS